MMRKQAVKSGLHRFERPYRERLEKAQMVRVDIRAANYTPCKTWFALGCSCLGGLSNSTTKNLHADDTPPETDGIAGRRQVNVNVASTDTSAGVLDMIDTGILLGMNPDDRAKR
jgi:hypothetical protein